MQKSLRILAIIIVLFSLNQLEAQESYLYKDKVFLKQGSLIMGEVSNYTPGENITIILRNGKEITIMDEQMKRVVMYSGKIDRVNRPLLPLKEGKIFNETHFSFLTNANGTGYALSHSLLYQHNQLLAYGGGIGLDNYYAAPGREIMPLFAAVKYNLSKGSHSPYIGMKMGYGFAFKRDQQNITEANGGLMTNPYFGIRMGSRGMIVNVFAGLKFQEVDYEVVNSWENRREDILHRRIEIGTSIMF